MKSDEETLQELENLDYLSKELLAEIKKTNTLLETKQLQLKNFTNVSEKYKKCIELYKNIVAQVNLKDN